MKAAPMAHARNTATQQSCGNCEMKEPKSKERGTIKKSVRTDISARSVQTIMNDQPLAYKWLACVSENAKMPTVQKFGISFVLKHASPVSSSYTDICVLAFKNHHFIIIHTAYLTSTESS